MATISPKVMITPTMVVAMLPSNPKFPPERSVLSVIGVDLQMETFKLIPET